MSRDRLLVIGGDAAGMSAAAQARRLRPDDLDITVLEQGPDVSYSACGIPYWVGDVVTDRDRLIARTPHEFAAQDIDVRMHTRAEAIDLAAGTVRTSTGSVLGYDRLVVATGGPADPSAGPGGLDAVGGARGAPPGRRRRHPRGDRGRCEAGRRPGRAATSAWRWPRCCTRAGWR